MEEQDDSDSKIQGIDNDEEQDELLNNGQANKLWTNDDTNIERKQHNQHHGDINGSKSHYLNVNCNFKEDIEKEGDRRGSIERDILKQRHMNIAKKRLMRRTSNGVITDTTIHGSQCLDPENSPRVLYKTDRTNIDNNKVQIREHEQRRIEDQAKEREYFMNGYIRTLNTNAYRPWVTEAYGYEVSPNIAYRVQAEPDMYRSRMNPYRPEEVLPRNDGYGILNKVHKDTLRTDHALYVDEYGHGKINKSAYHDQITPEDLRTINHRQHVLMNGHAYRHTHGMEGILTRESYNHAYGQEQFIGIDDCRLPILYRHAYIHNSYRYATMYNNIYNYPHTLEDVLAVNELNQAIMNRHAFDVYRQQVALDSYRLQSEMTPFHGRVIFSMNTGGLGSKSHRNVNYSELPGMFIHSPQVIQNNPYRTDSSGDVNLGGEEKALNLTRKRHVPYNVSQRNPEPIILAKKLATDKDKTKYEHSKTIADATYTLKNINQETTERIENSETVLSEYNKSEHVNICVPDISEHKYGPDLVKLSTKTKTFNMPTQTDYPVQINKTNNAGYGTLNSIVCTSAEQRRVMRNNDRNIKENSTVDETFDKSNALVREVNDLARGNHIKFLVIFFNRVTELVKETFPEFAKSLEKEIETLGTVVIDGKVKTDIQYICPLYCSVSTYSLPRFHDMSVDNKIEKLVNRVSICDVCSCIQKCYKLYKNKYRDLLLNNLVENDKAEEKQHRTTSVIRSVGVCKNMQESITKSGTETNGSSLRAGSLSKESPTEIEHLNTEQGKLNYASLTAYINIDKGDLANKITANLLKINIEKTIFDELSTLNVSSPNNDIESTLVATKIPRWSSSDKEEISTNDNLNNINQTTHKTSQENTQMNQNASGQIKSPVKDEPNLKDSVSLNEINNADNIESTLKNKIGRKPDSIFTCHICTCMFTYYTSFLNHLQKEHNINDVDAEIPDGCVARKCPFCGYYSKQKYHNERVKRAHPEIFTHKGDSKIKKEDITKIKMRQDKRKKSNKRKFVFICLVCNDNLMSYEVNGHRAAKHKGVNVPKMFTKRLLSK